MKLGTIIRATEIGKKGKHNKYIWCVCPHCKEERWAVYPRFLLGGNLNNYTYQCRKCSSKNQKHNSGRFKKGKEHSNWKGGSFKQKEYVFVKVEEESEFISMAKKFGNSSFYILEHRLMIAKKIKRPLSRDEIVHHLNGIKHDNRIENLALVTNQTHDTRSFIKQLQDRIKFLEEELCKTRQSKL